MLNNANHGKDSQFIITSQLIMGTYSEKSVPETFSNLYESQSFFDIFSFLDGNSFKVRDKTMEYLLPDVAI